MSGEDVPAPREHARIEHARFHRIHQREIIHLHGIEGIGKGEDGVHLLVGFLLGGRLS